jgi:hypothetical protein
MPSNKYKRLTEGLRRSQASLIIQLRTGHVVLNKYIYTESQRATHRDGHPADMRKNQLTTTSSTVRHENTRWSLGKKLGRNAKSLSYVLSNGKGVKELLKYVERTERLKNTPGEVDPTA